MLVQRKETEGSATYAEALLGCQPSTSTCAPENGHHKDCHSFCKRIRSLTPEILTAPTENCYDPVTGRRRAAERVPFDQETRDVMKNVREFFEELKRELGSSCNGTVFNHPVQMTALACGVSLGTAYRLKPSQPPQKSSDDEATPPPPPPPPRKLTKEEEARKALLEQNCEQMRILVMKKYGKEWSDIVRYFVLEELKQNENLTVLELHNKLVWAYADFPMPAPTLYAFLKGLGFTYRVEGSKSIVVKPIVAKDTTCTIPVTTLRMTAVHNSQ
ncbi:unnamed protein product [Cylicocyclus nassatus]|uniref:Uncharacterized protein n=1 Tax=Cylicocyclus nassatus TaxID=53992 RepID=A0AA36GEU6_CYLNA|nr:unnamed protein product [Cylicocyclus nassatus]